MAAPKFKIESGAQLFARLAKKPDIIKFYPVLFPSGPKQGDVIELSVNTHSPSIVMIDIICEALILNNLGKTRTMGVVIFKTDGKLNIEELIYTLRRKIPSHIDTNSNAEVDQLFQKILKEMYVVDVYDATQFYTTVHNLENILMEHRNISLVVIDTLTAFYWSEQGFKITKMDLYIKNLLRMIANVTRQYKIIIIYTRPDYFYSSIKDGIDNLETHEVPISDGVDYRVNISERNEKETYHVKVKTRDQKFEKCFNISIDNLIKWQ